MLDQLRIDLAEMTTQKISTSEELRHYRNQVYNYYFQIK